MNRSKSLAAENDHLQHVFLCQSGGGEKAIARHIALNKKVLVRDRLRGILDEDSEFFELGTTAGSKLYEIIEVQGNCNCCVDKNNYRLEKISNFCSLGYSDC